MNLNPKLVLSLSAVLFSGLLTVSCQVSRAAQERILELEQERQELLERASVAEDPFERERLRIEADAVAQQQRQVEVEDRSNQVVNIWELVSAAALGILGGGATSKLGRSRAKPDIERIEDRQQHIEYMLADRMHAFDSRLRALGASSTLPGKEWTETSGT